MKNDPSDLENPYLRYFYEGIEKTDGPEVQDFTPTLQELTQIILFHVQEFIERRFGTCMYGDESSEVEEDAIWIRLDKIRRVIRPDDFRRTVDLACIRFGEEVDPRLWDVFVYGDDSTRRVVGLATGEIKYELAGAFSKKRLAEGVPGREEVAPPDVLQRLERPIPGWTKDASRFSH